MEDMDGWAREDADGGNEYSGGYIAPLSTRFRIKRRWQMKKLVLPTVFLLAFLAVDGTFAYGMDRCWGGRFPHGSYCQGRGCGWYGERQAVRTKAEALRILTRYFSSYDDLRISDIRERKWFYEADIRDVKNRLIDVVIVDKRTGRIRSIY
jgi:hypothetical protein